MVCILYVNSAENASSVAMSYSHICGKGMKIALSVSVWRFVINSELYYILKRVGLPNLIASYFPYSFQDYNSLVNNICF